MIRTHQFESGDERASGLAAHLRNLITAVSHLSSDVRHPALYHRV